MRDLGILVFWLICLRSFAVYAQPPFKETCHGQLELSFFDSPTVFESAKRACKNYGGHLVKVDSAAVQQAIEDALGPPDGKRYYIGGEESENGYIWLADETAVCASGYTNWRPGQPNNYAPDENCIGIGDHSQYQWTDVQCIRDQSRYICQRDESDINLRTSSLDNSFTCQSSDRDISVKWTRNSKEVTTTDKDKVHQITYFRESVLVVQNMNITDAGTYTCIGKTKCLTKQQDIEVSVNGTPAIQEIESNKCNASLFVTWKPGKAAIGFPHSFSVTGPTNKHFFLTPNTSKLQTTEILFLSLSTAYTVKITACLDITSCNTGFDAVNVSQTDGVTDPVGSAFVQRVDDDGCKVSWSSPEHDSKYTITTNCTFGKSRIYKDGYYTISRTANLARTEFLLQPTPNQICKVSIQAEGCGAISQAVKANGSCTTPPKEPDFISAPERQQVGKDSAAISFVKPAEDNGLISCVFFILCYGKCSIGGFTIQDLRSANKSNSTNERNAIAMAFPMAKFPGNRLSFTLSTGNISFCNVDEDGDTNATNLKSGIFQGKNAVAETSMHVGIFVVIATPVNGRILLKRSPMVTLRNSTGVSDGGTTEASTDNNLWVIGLIVGLLGVIIGVVSGVLIARRNQSATHSNDERPTAVQTVTASSRMQAAVDAQESTYGYENDVESPIYEEMKESGTGARNREPSSYENI